MNMLAQMIEAVGAFKELKLRFGELDRLETIVTPFSAKKDFLMKPMWEDKDWALEHIMEKQIDLKKLLNDKYCIY